MVIIGFIRTTIALIAFCALGVSGIVTDFTVREDYILASTEQPVLMAWGGFVLAPSHIPETMIRHEYGHLIQERKYEYLHELLVVLPSLISRAVSASPEQHYSRWFEIEATELGAR